MCNKWGLCITVFNENHRNCLLHTFSPSFPLRLLYILDFRKSELKLVSFHRPYPSLETLDTALQEVDNIPAYLPNCLQLKDIVTKAKKWLHEAESLQVKCTLAEAQNDFESLT